MASKTKTIYSPASSQYGYTLGVNASEQTVTDTQKANNKTSVKASATLYSNVANFSTSSSHTLYCYWYDNNENSGGKLVASTVIKASTRGTTYKAEATFDVPHKADGTLKGYAKAVWDKVSTNNYVPDDASLSLDEFSLTTLPRETKIGDHSGTIGTNLPFTWSRASSSFTHTLVIKFGSKTYTYPSLTTGKDWTPPAELYSQMSDKIGTGTLTLTTYSGSTTIGSAQTATLTLSAKQADVEPQIGDSTFKDTNSAMVGITNGTDVIVTNKSLTQINFSFSTRGYAKAKTLIINNVSRTIPTGVVRSDDASITDYAVSIDLGTIKTNSFTISLTDTREYPANSTPKIDDDKFIDYIPLDISPTFKRIAPTTGEVGLKFTGKYFNNTFGKVDNSLTIAYKYKEKNAETYSDLITLQKDVDYKIVGNTYYSGNGEYESVIKLNAVFDYKKLYEVQFFVNDAVTTLPVINATITKGIPIFWWNGEKVVVNGELYIADTNGDNLQPVGGGDSLPINSIFEYDGDTVPDGYEVVDDNSFCQVWTDGLMTVTSSQGNTLVDIWTTSGQIKSGKFEYDATQKGIKIPAGSAQIIQTNGLIAGNGNMTAEFILFDSSGNRAVSGQQFGILHNKAGNGYWKIPLPSNMMVIPDTNQTYYLKLYVGGYNDTLLLNSGFGYQPTVMGVRKIA